MQADTEYEKLTREIYQTLLNADGVTNIEVKHNVTIHGKAHKHQIDVYWEYELAGIRHKVAIECKNYNRAVSKGAVTSFYGVLSDIGNINGVIVTKVGYQEVAKKYAEHYGINLKELREPTDEDWKGRVKTIHTTINMVSTNVKGINIKVDESWVKENIKTPFNEGFKYTVQGMSNEMWIKDKAGNLIKNLLQLQEELPVEDWEAEKDLTHTYEYEDGYFEFADVGIVKVNGVQFKYDISVASTLMILDGSTIAKAILKDALTGDLKFFNTDGGVM